MLLSKRRTLSLFLSATTLLLVVSPSLAKKPPKPPADDPPTASYRVLHLEEDPVFVNAFANDISDAGRVVGNVRDLADNALPTCWTVDAQGQSSALHFLELFGGPGDIGVASGVNTLGEIVGSGSDGAGWVGLYWLDRLATPIVLPPLLGYDESGAYAINDDGVICGSSGRWVEGVDENGEPTLAYEYRAVAWRVSERGLFGPVELPSLADSGAMGISDSDDLALATIVGVDGGAAEVWTVLSGVDGTLTVHPAPVILDISADANGVNDAGVICGSLWSQDVPAEAIVWDGDEATILDRSRNMLSAWAHGVNNSGVIVGEGDYWKKFTQGRRAVVWPSKSASMVTLNDFLGRTSPFASLTTARAINASGQIVGWGLDAPYDGSSYGAFLAIPE